MNRQEKTHTDQPNDELVPLTYDDVMLDWAVAELLSPTFEALWNGPECEQLRAKVRNEEIGSLSASERAWLIKSLIQSRNVMIPVYGPFPSWSFQCVTYSSEELSGFSIMHQFGHASLSFGQFSERIKKAPFGGLDEPGMRRCVQEMLEQSRSGKKLRGLPIAISRD